MRKNLAYTILESVIVITIIGVISIFALTVVKADKNKYGPLYYSAYEVLRKANYNVYADPDCPFISGAKDGDGNYLNPDVDKANFDEINMAMGSNATKCCDENLDNGCSPRPFPQNSYQLCERLSEFIPYIKATGGKNCGTSSEVADQRDNLDIADTATDFDDLSTINSKVRLILTNSMKVYISRRYEYVYSGGNMHYFIVYVDLNGKKGPNSVYPVCSMARDNGCFDSYENGKKSTDKDSDKGDDIFSAVGYLPDIVAFVLTSTGEIVPLGYPAYITEYISAKVVFPEFAGFEEHYKTSQKLSLEQQFSNAMTFVQARHSAWGNSGTVDIAQSIDFHRELFGDSTQVFRNRNGLTCLAVSRFTINGVDKWCCSSPNDFGNFCEENESDWLQVQIPVNGTSGSRLVSFFYDSNFLGGVFKTGGTFEKKEIYPNIYGTRPRFEGGQEVELSDAEIDSRTRAVNGEYNANCQYGTYNCRVNLIPYSNSR